MKQINVADIESSIGKELSFFSNSPFDFEGTTYESVESFIQSLKFQDSESKNSVAQLESHKARMRGKKKTKALIEKPVIYWDNKEVELFSDEYYEIVYNAIVHKFNSNERARTALLLTDGYEIIFDNGYPEPKFNTLPYEMYINMLIVARDDVKNSLSTNISKIYKRPTI